MKKDINTLIEKLSKIGTVQICKAGVVFTLLITGENFTSVAKIIEVQFLVTQFCGDKYPTIEVMRNNEDLICIVLKP